MKHVFAVLLVVFALIPGQALALRLDDADNLIGQYIAQAGEITEFRCPPSGKFNCLSWPRNFYRMSFDTCFEIQGHRYVGYGAYGLIAVNDNGQTSLFTIGGISGDVYQHRIVMYDCPSRF